MFLYFFIFIEVKNNLFIMENVASISLSSEQSNSLVSIKVCVYTLMYSINSHLNFALYNI